MKAALGRRFLILWFGQLVSGLGTGMTGFALGVYVYQLTGSASGFAMVILCLFLPSILLRPLGGVLADRLDRRIMIAVGDVGSSAGVLFLLLSLLTGTLTPWKIYLGVALGSACAALQGPAYKASISDIVPDDQFSRAGGLMQLAASAQHLISPAAAGLILAVGNLGTVLAIDLSTFLVAIVAVVVLRASMPHTTRESTSSLQQDLKHGWDVLRRNVEVMRLVVVLSLVTFFVGLLQTLFGPMVLAYADARSLGIAQSISATGMLVSSLSLGLFALRRQRPALVVGLIVAAAGMMLLGAGRTIVVSTCAFFVFFAALPFVNTSAEVLIRRGIPAEVQGPAWGFVGLISQLGYILAYIGCGSLADRVLVPMMEGRGSLTELAGRIVGTGPGAGIGLMIVLAGFGLGVVALLYALGVYMGRRADRPAPRPARIIAATSS